MVEFMDSSVLAQLGVPDMKLPILYSLSYPERIAGPWPRLDLPALQQLEFFAVDPQRFPSLAMAYDVLRQGQNAGAVFNTANEVGRGIFPGQQNRVSRPSSPWSATCWTGGISSP